MRSPRRILPYSISRTAYVEYEPGVVGAASEVIELVRQAAPWMHVEHIGSTAVPGCAGKGIVDLMALYPAGKLEDARAGDFLDFSRNNKTGHSVIFVDWVKDDSGKITGFKYFSSNSKGVGFATEYFVDAGGKVLHEYFRLARVGSIENYTRFDRTKIPFRRAYAP